MVTEFLFVWVRLWTVQQFALRLTWLLICYLKKNCISIDVHQWGDRVFWVECIFFLSIETRLHIQKLKTFYPYCPCGFLQSSSY